jgi:hypothetical protein
VLPLLLNLTLQYGITKVKVNLQELKLNETQQFLFYTNGDVDLSGKNISIINRNTKAIIVAIMVVDLVVYSEKT